MTFCIGIKVREGIVALADTRIVRGSEQLNKQKLAEFRYGGQSVVTMTSGLRSVRDKTITYLEESLRDDSGDVRNLYQFVNRFGQQLRRVKEEDGAALQSTNHTFNLHAVIGGRLVDDPEPRLFHVYPEGNWIGTSEDSPYFVIGRTYYSKSILHRLLTFDTSLHSAVRLAVLAFEATRTSVTDVDYPIDLAVLPSYASLPRLCRFTESDLQDSIQWWSNTLTDALAEMPMNWASQLFKDQQPVGESNGP